MNSHTDFTGQVTKIRVLTLESMPLVRFTLSNEQQTFNCLIKTLSLRFLNEVIENSEITVYCIFNSRSQFVVNHYAVKGPTAIQYFFETSPYPSEHKS